MNGVQCYQIIQVEKDKFVAASSNGKTTPFEGANKSSILLAVAMYNKSDEFDKKLNKRKEHSFNIILVVTIILGLLLAAVTDNKKQTKKQCECCKPTTKLIK